MKLKVCGMKYKANIKAIAALKPDYMGFIFYEKSSRCVTEKIPQIPEVTKKVGVFVNARLEVVQKAVLKHGLKAVQLHGAESPEYCQVLKTDAIEIIKVFSIKDQFDFNKLTPYEPHVNYFLFDNKITKLGFGKVPMRKNESLDVRLNLKKLSKLNWKPMYNLEESLKKTINYYKR